MQQTNLAPTARDNQTPLSFMVPVQCHRASLEDFM